MPWDRIDIPLGFDIIILGVAPTPQIDVGPLYIVFGIARCSHTMCLYVLNVACQTFLTAGKPAGTVDEQDTLAEEAVVRDDQVNVVKGVHQHVRARLASR